ncbi:MAG TPA: ABC transporter permease, partial [Candidatus Limnocylindrales bacterium]|nr:ABC transporter permease [Candidatus Limnocylindrales bacterium]
PGRWRGSLRRILGLIAFLLLAALVWEGFKFVAGDPWRFPELGFIHDPPFSVLQATDRQLPHLWDIFGALFEPVQRNQDETLGSFLVSAALYTWSEALIGFAIGAVIGLTLASIFVHSRLLERAFVPYVIASQTIPIVALAPIIVVGFGRGLTAVVIIATYLTFFPVTIAAMRGLSSSDPRALELMRSYAASKWQVYRKVRLPASVPYLFTALKVAATGSIVGAIIGEGPGGVPAGLGRAIDNFNQQYITGPEKLWATILIAAVLGIAFYLIVQVAESLTLRRRRAARQTS